jgi:hypothetical protein
METSGPSGHSPPKRLDPQTRQNALAMPSGGRVDLDQLRTLEQSEALARDASLRE